MKLFRILGLSLLIVGATGCAVGNQYDYRSAEVSLPLTGDGDVGVAVLENRSYVLSGNKNPNFVGTQRGGFGNPFDVTTGSGQALVSEMSDALEKGLRNSGYTVSKIQVSSSDPSAVISAIAENGKVKNIVLTVTEWKTDIYMNMSLHFNLVLQIVGKDGTTIATNQMQGEEKLSGAGFESQNSRLAADAFEIKIGRLFNSPEVIAALKN